jgi:hypothetical protein
VHALALAALSERGWAEVGSGWAAVMCMLIDSRWLAALLPLS